MKKNRKVKSKIRIIRDKIKYDDKDDTLIDHIRFLEIHDNPRAHHVILSILYASWYARIYKAKVHIEKYTSLSLDERNNTKNVNTIDKAKDMRIDANIPSHKLIFSNAEA